MKRLTIACAVFIASCGGSNDSVTPINADPQTPSNDGTNEDPLTGASTINRDNHSAILAEVFKVYTGRAFADRLRSIPIQINEIGASNIDTAEQVCDNGGTVGSEMIDEIGFFSTEFNYQDCQIEQIVLNGDYKYSGNDEETLRSSVDGLSAEFGGGITLDFTGLTGLSCCRSSISYTSTEEFDYYYASPAERFKIIGATTYFSDGEDYESDTRSASMSGGFQIETPVSGSDPLAVSVETDFFFESGSGLSFTEAELLASNWTFSAGRLKIAADDGSILTLDAESGDEATAKITIENSDGSETFDQPWSLWSGILNSADQ